MKLTSSIVLLFLLMSSSRSTFDLKLHKLFCAEASHVAFGETSGSPRFLWPSKRTTTTTSKPQVPVQPFLLNDTVHLRGCGGLRDPEYPVAQAIMGGTEAMPHSWPWMGAMLIVRPLVVTFSCACSLITPKHAITAAHCVKSASGVMTDKNRVKVLFGIHELSAASDATLFHVTQIDVHPSYSNSYNDVAILSFVRDVFETVSPVGSESMPVCLPTLSMIRERFVGETGTVIGWGRQSVDGKTSNVLLQVNIPIISNKQCAETFEKMSIFSVKFPEGFSEAFLCAISTGGGKDSCHGDSGGPLMIQREGQWFIVGIVSFGVGCGSTEYPGVYTRVTSHLQWIYAVIGQS